MCAILVAHTTGARSSVPIAACCLLNYRGDRTLHAAQPRAASMSSSNVVSTYSSRYAFICMWTIGMKRVCYVISKLLKGLENKKWKNLPTAVRYTW